jgi:anti-sigma factor RsiW
MTMSAFTCRDYRRLLSDALDGPLPTDERTAFDAHGAGCPPCLAHMKDAVVLREAVRGVAAFEEKDDATAPALPESLVQRILSAAKAARTAPSQDVRKKA